MRSRARVALIDCLSSFTSACFYTSERCPKTSAIIGRLCKGNVGWSERVAFTTTRLVHRHNSTRRYRSVHARRGKTDHTDAGRTRNTGQ